MDLVSVGNNKLVATQVEILYGAGLALLLPISLWSCSSSVTFKLQGHFVNSYSLASSVF